MRHYALLIIIIIPALLLSLLPETTGSPTSISSASDDQQETRLSSGIDTSIAYNRELMNQIPAAGQFTPTWGSISTIDLQQSVELQGNGYVIAQIPMGGSSTHYYTVEASRNSIDEGVLIYEMDPTSSNPPVLVTSSIEHHDNITRTWPPGKMFTDPARGVTVLVNSATPTGYSVTVALGAVLPRSIQVR